MPAYVVGDIHITDPVAFRAHVPVAPRSQAVILRAPIDRIH